MLHDFKPLTPLMERGHSEHTGRELRSDPLVSGGLAQSRAGWRGAESDGTSSEWGGTTANMSLGGRVLDRRALAPARRAAAVPW